MIPEQWSSSLTAISRKFREVWDGTRRSSQNQIYTCMAKMILKSLYIAWEGRQEKGIRKILEERTKELVRKKKNSLPLIKLLQPSYSGYAEDNLCILYSQYFFQTIYDCYLFSIDKPVLSLTLYKFIVWACWAKTQSYLRSKPKLVLTCINIYLHTYNLYMKNNMNSISKY